MHKQAKANQYGRGIIALTLLLLASKTQNWCQTKGAGQKQALGIAVERSLRL